MSELYIFPQYELKLRLSETMPPTKGILMRLRIHGWDKCLHTDAE